MSGSTAPTPTRGSRLLVAAANVLALAVVAVVLTRQREQPASVHGQVTAAYVEAWNQRDAQAVSELTCLWNPAFTPVGVIEDRSRASRRGVPPSRSTRSPAPPERSSRAATSSPSTSSTSAR